MACVWDARHLKHPLCSSLLTQLKEYISLLEAQLENHLQTASSERQNYTKEVEVVSAITFSVSSSDPPPVPVSSPFRGFDECPGGLDLCEAGEDKGLFAAVWVVDA